MCSFQKKYHDEFSPYVENRQATNGERAEMLNYKILVNCIFIMNLRSI